MKHCHPQRQAIGFVAYYFRTYLTTLRNIFKDGKPTSGSLFLCWAVAKKDIQHGGAGAVEGCGLPLHMIIGIWMYVSMYGHPASGYVHAQMVIWHLEACFHQWLTNTWGCVSVAGHLGRRLHREGALSSFLAHFHLGKVFFSSELQSLSLDFFACWSSVDSPELPRLKIRPSPMWLWSFFRVFDESFLILQSLRFLPIRNHAILPMFLVRQNSDLLFSGGGLYWSFLVHQWFSVPKVAFCVKSKMMNIHPKKLGQCITPKERKGEKGREEMVYICKSCKA